MNRFCGFSPCRSGSVSLGDARTSFSQAFHIHALPILIFCAHFSAGITRMETSSTWIFFFFCPHSCTPSLNFFFSLYSIVCMQKMQSCFDVVHFFLSSPCVGGKRFNIHGCSVPPSLPSSVLWRRLRWVYTSLFFSTVPLLCVFSSSLAYFLSGLMDRGAKWAVFLLFQQRGHLYSIPGSQVSYSAPLQVMSGPWKVLQINLSWCFEGNLTSMHSSFHRNNYKGIVRRESEGEREKNPGKLGALFLCVFSLDEYGQCNGGKKIWQVNTMAERVFFLFYPPFLFCFISSCRDSEKARWVTGHEKRLLWNSCFLWAGPSYICLLFPDEISARFQWDSFSSRLIYIYSIHRTNPEVNGGDSGAGPLLY